MRSDEQDRLRIIFDAYAGHLDALYAALTWPQKAILLRAIMRAGDHPPEYAVTHSGKPSFVDRFVGENDR